MENLRVGHFTNQTYGTGISVFLFEKPAQASYHLCGSAPASHELHTLDLETSVTHIDGLVLTGGSALGLGAISGVARWFKENDRGFPTPYGRVPIVPGAGIFDLGVGQPLPPTSEEAYQACLSAIQNNQEQGRIGAGTGASVGKAIPHASPMSSGIGFAEINLPNGLSVAAYAVVNSLGDIYDATGQIIAGACLPDKRFADCQAYLLAGENEAEIFTPKNTTLVAIFTNAACSQVVLKRIAKMATAGMAKAVAPVFTQYDGDLIFCASLGKEIASELMLGVIASEVTRQAIVNSVKNAVVLKT